MTIINRVNGFRVNAKTIRTNSFYGYKGITEKEYGRIVKKIEHGERFLRPDRHQGQSGLHLQRNL